MQFKDVDGPHAEARRPRRRREGCGPQTRFILLTALALSLGGGQTLAGPIPGLFATGVDAAGTPLPPDTVDPHWRLTHRPGPTPTGSPAFVVSDGYPIPPWIANSAASRWIAPQADQSFGSPAGEYTYELRFDLSSLDPATASITFRWSSDNEGPEVRLNGKATGITYDGDFTTFSQTFTVQEGFVAGTNILEFVVRNAGNSINPTGFRAEISGTADPLPPPGTPPSIRRQPEDVTAAPGDSATFRVDATGAPPLRFQWRRDAVPLAGATSSVFNIPAIQPVWIGGYDVVVRNEAGAVTSRVARLTVQSASPEERTWEPPGPSTRRTGITLSELLLHPEPRPDGRQTAFLELHNTQPFFEDLSGWRISGAFEFTFPSPTLLPANARLVVAPSPTNLRAVHNLPESTLVLGGFPYTPAPGKSGSLQVRKRSGAVVLEVAWDGNDPAWPLPAFGPGHALVLAFPSRGEGNPRAWDTGSRLGGTPGDPEPVPSGPLESVALNELLIGPVPFVELLNRAPGPVDLSGCLLQVGTSGATFQFPAGTSLAANGLMAFAPPGFQPNPRGGALLLWTPDARRVLDAVRHGAQPEGVASGPDADPRMPWRLLERPTPGEPNARPAMPPVVIHEILANPPSGDSNDEFIELHNPGSEPVSLEGWRFTDGVDFRFPAGAVIPASGFVVTVPDRTRFLATHPDLDPAQVFGNYSGQLSNGGERLALARPLPSANPITVATPMVDVDDVTFVDDSRWSRWSDGGSSSLELVDPRADRRLAPNWADSDETGRAPWTVIEATGILNLAHPGVPAADQLQVLLLGAGACLIDNVEVLVNGANRVVNGTFEAGTQSWVFQGTHRLSRAEPGGGFGGGQGLRIVASDRGDHVANRVRTVLRSSIPAGTPVTLRAHVRWLQGHPEILLRLRNGALEAAGRLTLPPFAGTPGAANSRRRPNAPPAILDVDHRPVLPAANQPVRVTARVSDPDGIRRVVLRHRLDPSSTTQDTPMLDDGTGADEFAGDGLFTAQIPGQPSGTLVAFRVLAEDGFIPVSAAATFPDAESGQGECLVRFGETLVPGAFANYRLWMTRSDHDRWGAREKMSNEDIPVTFVLGSHRVIHGAGAHFSGSSYTSPGYTTPTGALCGYDVRFPGGEDLLGDNRLTLDWPIRDDTDQREQLMFWFLEQFGLPNLHRRHVHLHVNGVRRGTIYDDVQQPDRDTLEEWFPEDDQGSLWKTDCWNEFDNAGNRVDPCILNTLERFPATGPLKTARYRWNWRPRAVRGSANDFSDLFALIEAANTNAAAYLGAMESLVDVDHWMRTFAMNDLASYWDGFGNPNAKNTFLYKPERDRWKLMCWDFDVGLGVFNDPPNAALFDVNDPAITRMYRTPAFVRRYWAALDEAVNGFFRTGAGSRIDALLDAKYAAFRANGVALAAPTGIKSWITQRRTYLLNQLATVRAPFAITTPPGPTLVTGTEPALLRGTAPVAVRHLTVNGVAWTTDWLTVTNWSLRVPLNPGTNVLRLAGLSLDGTPVPGSEASVTVVFTGTSNPPTLRINEWMASNRTTVADPADGDADDWFELFNPGALAVDLTGFTLTDDPARPRRFVVPPGFRVEPGGFLLVWADGEPEQTRPGLGLHTSFRLDQDGSDLLLFDPIGRLVDAVRFGRQSPDVSQGRWSDGGPGPFLALNLPTPGGANAQPAPSAIDLAFSASLDPASRTVVLTWTGVEGRAYAIDASESLASPPSWTPLGMVPAGAGGPRVFRDPLAPGIAARFYRIRLLP